jgi:hypothetical protein
LSLHSLPRQPQSNRRRPSPAPNRIRAPELSTPRTNLSPWPSNRLPAYVQPLGALGTEGGMLMTGCRCSADRSCSTSPSLRVRTLPAMGSRSYPGTSGIAERARPCPRATLTMDYRYWSDNRLRLVVRYVNEEFAQNTHYCSSSNFESRLTS